MARWTWAIWLAKPSELGYFTPVPPSDPEPAASSGQQRFFVTTHWSVVLAAGWSGLAVTGATTGWDEGRAAGAMAGGFGAGGAEEAPTAAAASRRAPAGT